MQFKKLMLVFASLILVAFSFNFSKSASSTASIQSKSIQWVTLAADDIEDDNIGHVDLPTFISIDFRSVVCKDNGKIKNLFASADPILSPVPDYLRVRNFRI